MFSFKYFFKWCFKTWYLDFLRTSWPNMVDFERKNHGFLTIIFQDLFLTRTQTFKIYFVFKSVLYFFKNKISRTSWPKNFDYFLQSLRRLNFKNHLIINSSFKNILKVFPKKKFVDFFKILPKSSFFKILQQPHGKKLWIF